MSETKKLGVKLNLGLVFPLAGILLAYLLILLTVYIDMTVNVTHQNTGDQYLHPYTYLVLLAIAILVVTSLVGRRIAGKQRALEPTLQINRNTYTFTTIAIMSSLIAAVIYALAIFLTDAMQPKAEPTLRILQLYVPILLDAALLVFGILRAFVVKPKGASK